MVLDEIKDIFVGMGFEILEDREVETGRLQLHQAQLPRGTPRPRVDGHLLLHRGQLASCCARRPLPCRSARWRRASSAHPHHRPRPRVPQGRGGRHPLPHVPPDRGHGHRQGRHHGRPEGHAQRRHAQELYGEDTRHALPSRTTSRSPSRAARWTSSATSAAA